MTTEAHTEISKRLETMPDHVRGSADMMPARSPDWDEPFLSLSSERQVALLAELRTEQDIEAMSARMGMPTVHRHFDWCMFADQGDNVADCLNADTGAMECEGLQLSVPLTIEDQPPLNVMPTASHDVVGPYVWMGKLDGVGDVWLTPQQAVTLGHFLLATAALITEV